MDLFQYILLVGIIATTIGWGLDWIFSGSLNPIYVHDTVQEQVHEYSTMTCRVCKHELRYSVQKVRAAGEVKCDKCGSFLTEEQ